MIQDYKGEYPYNDGTIRNWNSAEIGVYYCGFRNVFGSFVVAYVGKATSENGIRGRLLEHQRVDYWPDVTHFGYKVCATSQVAEAHEAAEIKRLQPKYNKVGK